MFCAFVMEYKASIQGKARRFHIFSFAKAFNVVDFEVQMWQMESSARGIQHELERIGFEKWSRAFCSPRRYNIMTTNMLESLNSTILSATMVL